MSFFCTLYLLLLYSSVGLVSGVDRIKLNKCCPNNTIAVTSEYFIQNCTEYSIVTDYSNVSVYNFENNEINKTDYKVNDIFSVTYNPETINNSYYQQDNTMFLTKDGMVYMEYPNTESRWIINYKETFCVDHFIEVYDDGELDEYDVEVGLFLCYPLEENERPQEYSFISITLYISTVFFAMVLFVYAMLPELQNLPGLVLMSYAACEIIRCLCMGLSLDLDTYENTCSALTIMIYYFIIAGFFWMNVMSFDIWRTFRGYATIRSLNKSSVRLKFYLYCLYAFGVPLLLTIFFVTVYFMDMSSTPYFIKPNKPNECFITGYERFLYLCVPISIILSANCLLFIMTVYNIWRVQRDTAVLRNMGNRTQKQNKQSFFLYLKLSVVMGINWIFEILEDTNPDLVLWKYTGYYNGLTGVFVFIIFICNKKIFKMLKKRFKETAIFRDKSTFESVPNSTISASCDTSLAEDSDDATAISDLALQVCLDPNGRSYK